jgi:hypothetical protein
MEANDSTIGVEKNLEIRFKTFPFTLTTTATFDSQSMSCADRQTLFSTCKE